MWFSNVKVVILEHETSKQGAIKCPHLGHLIGILWKEVNIEFLCKSCNIRMEPITIEVDY